MAYTEPHLDESTFGMVNLIIGSTIRMSLTVLSLPGDISGISVHLKVLGLSMGKNK